MTRVNATGEAGSSEASPGVGGNNAGAVPFPPGPDTDQVPSYTPQQAEAGGTATTPHQFVGSPWSTGLFDCHEDQTNAVMTAILPCVTFGQIAEVVDAGELTCPLGSFIYLLMMPAVCSQWVMGSKYRTKIRTRYGLVEAPYQDVISHIFCPCCSLCQEFRELRNRGLDPALGWNGILAQQGGGGMQYRNQANIPPPAQSMSM